MPKSESDTPDLPTAKDAKQQTIHERDLTKRARMSIIAADIKAKIKAGENALETYVPYDSEDEIRAWLTSKGYMIDMLHMDSKERKQYIYIRW